MIDVQPPVPVLTIVFSVFNLIVSLAIPVVLFLVFRKKFGCRSAPFIAGMLTFIVFSMILEPLLHNLVGISDPNSPIVNNIWLYALYGGFAAGILEETGRFVTMKLFLKKYYDNDRNALMFGAGHGGIEAVLILGSGSVNNIMYAVMLNSGMEQTLLDALPDEALKTQLQTIFDQIRTTHPAMLLVAPAERLIAVTFHIALSVLVWLAVTRKGKTWLYPLAVVLHAVLDGAMVIVNKLTGSLLITELFIAVFTAAVCFFSYRIWKASKKPEAESAAPPPER